MAEHLPGRAAVLDALLRELVGPAPAGEAVDLFSERPFASKRDSYGPNTTPTGEEILGWTRPIKRYGAGVLFPSQVRSDDFTSLTTAANDTTDDRDDALDALGTGALDDELVADLKRMEGRKRNDDENRGADLAGANARRPSSLGLSFAVSTDCHAVTIRATGGRYDAIKVKVPSETAGEDPHVRTVHARAPWRLDGTRDIGAGSGRAEAGGTGLGELSLTLEITIRPPGADGARLVTVVLVNRSAGVGELDTRCTFQTELEVEAVGATGAPMAAVVPYPGPPLAELDDEERSLELLYRDRAVFAVGHNCAADWDARPGSRSVSIVRGLPIGLVETPSTTPDVRTSDGRVIDVAMAPLAGLDGTDRLIGLDDLVDAYEAWVTERAAELADVPTQLEARAGAHVDACRIAVKRMREGLTLLRRDPDVARAFELANRAILVQQMRSDLRPRLVSRIGRDGTAEYGTPHPIVPMLPKGTRGRWRAFQMAFILASLPSTVDSSHPDRELVELIFFPTGGGKTEAYLGLAAFSILLRRLRDPDDTGVDVLMRYTLRLLTAQQFLRATRLVCALEDVRRSMEGPLGRRPISIGIWLGRATTPNTRAQAKTALRRLQRDPAGADDPFLLGNCPWCGAELGAVNAGKTRPTKVVGYREDDDGVAIHCPDTACTFHDQLPVSVVDEDVYANQPEIVIGTVDKFAMLAWRDDARSLFGIGPDGARRTAPPTLIIQDELHLIAGPLGSMVGLYELAIEELCTDHRGDEVVLPKIVTSTATIRGYEHQVRALFGRDRVALFPPHGLRADDSFFARSAVDGEGNLLPGRLYVGVHASNHTSLIETQVSTMAAMAQGAFDLGESARDPWWTQLVFFNSLRELGTSLSLLQSNVPMHLRAIAQRDGIAKPDQRRLKHVVELTSRLRNDEVPKAIAMLERRVDDERPVDVCLASNIIEVGIDIDRLSSILVVGQPKTTSQYIQVTGRVGRRWWERPGLVVTLMNPNRARDRSHYERFRSYHERLYAAVEPTSVTPFSPPAVDRALHGALLAFLRSTTNLDATTGPSTVPDHLLERFRELVDRRVTIVDPEERDRALRSLDQRLAEFRAWGWGQWQRGYDGEEGLITPQGEDLSVQLLQGVWQTPMSMRTVDAECELDVTRAYVLDHLDQEATRG